MSKMNIFADEFATAIPIIPANMPITPAYKPVAEISLLEKARQGRLVALENLARRKAARQVATMNQQATVTKLGFHSSDDLFALFDNLDNLMVAA